jgi:group I intron endonuclease
MVDCSGNSKNSFQNGRIYRILNYIDNEVYVGSTCQALSKRMAKHREEINNETKARKPLYIKMKEHGVEHFYIELIEEHPCENGEQLRKREGHYIREIGTLNKTIEGRTRKEYREETERGFKREVKISRGKQREDSSER